MNSNRSIILTGTAIESYTATVTLRAGAFHHDGIDISIAVKLLEYEIKFETFFYGYNIDLFLREGKEVIASRAVRAHLINWEQGLLLEFICQSNQIFLSLNYESVLPQPPADNLLGILRAESRLDSTRTIGSRFSLSFMRLHNPLSEITDWLARVLDDHAVSRENPYPH